MHSTLRTCLIAAVAAAALAACGGGGNPSNHDGDDSPSGLWSGSASNGRAGTTLILSDGSYWGVYSTREDANVIGGVVQGHIDSTNDVFASNDLRDYNFEGFGVSKGTITGDYSERVRLQGTVNYESGTQVFGTATYEKSFEDTPTLSAIAGDYSGSVTTALGVTEVATVNIPADGELTGTAGACDFTGTVSPRRDANAYAVTVTFGSGCALPGQKLRGIGVFDPVAKRLYAIGQTTARTDAFLFVGDQL